MLNWETVLDTTPNDETETTYIAMEPNNKLYQYRRDADIALDRPTLVAQGDYSSLLWGADQQSLTTNNKVRRIGIKHFPQIGAIGFWTLLNEERSQILAPVHYEAAKYAKPNFTVEETSDTFIFHMGSPTDVSNSTKYKCFRIILRLGKFALEYVTYEETLEVPKPTTTGTYDIYCIGYVHEGEAVSEDSTHYYIDVAGTQTEWPGPDASSDLYVTDVEVTQENKINIRRSDGFTKDSDNIIPVPIAATFLEDGKLQITLSNGSVVTTDNALSGGGVLASAEEVLF